MVDSFLSSRNGLRITEIGVGVVLLGTIVLAALKTMGVF